MKVRPLSQRVVVFILRGEGASQEVLLIQKKRGFGKGMVVGPGGEIGGG